MSACTPGPWTIAQNDDWNTVVIAQGAEVCTVIEHHGGDRRANAALICAAPDLLAACELFARAAHDARDALNGAGLACPSSIALAAERARAAIARAEGRS